VCSDFVVIAGISFQDPAQVRLAQDDDMVDALTPDRPENVTLTNQEITSLKQVGNRALQSTVPDEHRDRLIKAGYIREVARHPHRALALTGRGIARIALDK
jgi:hypothetical protein